MKVQVCCSYVHGLKRLQKHPLCVCSFRGEVEMVAFQGQGRGSVALGRKKKWLDVSKYVHLAIFLDLFAFILQLGVIIPNL